MSTFLEGKNPSLNGQRSRLPSSLEANGQNIISEEGSARENVAPGMFSVVRSVLSKSALCQFVNGFDFMINLTAAYSRKKKFSCFTVKFKLIFNVILNSKNSKCSQ